MRRLVVLLLLSATLVHGEHVDANELPAVGTVRSGCSETLKAGAYADRLISDQARYQERGDSDRPDRCEGQITEKQGLSAKLAGLERSCEPMLVQPPPKFRLLWTASARIDLVLLNLRSYHTVRKYALDSLRPANPASFSWSSKLLTSLGIHRNDLRVLVSEDPPPVAGSPLYLPTSWADQSCPSSPGYVAQVVVTHLTKQLDVEVYPSGKKLGETGGRQRWQGAVDQGGVVPLSLPAKLFGGEGEYVVRLSEPDPDAPSDPTQSTPLLTFRMFHGAQAPPVGNH
jgi:hypothetical protein